MTDVDNLVRMATPQWLRVGFKPKLERGFTCFGRTA